PSRWSRRATSASATSRRSPTGRIRRRRAWTACWRRGRGPRVRTRSSWRRALPPGASPAANARVRFAGMLSRGEYRALLRRARVFITAPRREDYGIAQLEALADGCALVTTAAPGPYAALPLDRRFVPDDDGGLAAALRAALDGPADDYAERALAALAPFRHAAVDRTVAEELLPRLLASAGR